MLIYTLIIVAILVAGYLIMSIDKINHINRGAVAMFSGVIVWLVYMLEGAGFLNLMHPDDFAQGMPIHKFVADNIIMKYVAEACQVILFLIATNTIVEVMNNNGVFDPLTKWLRMRSGKRFLWALSILTFLVSANVDNLTTVVLMMTIMCKIVSNHTQKVIYACVILVAANLGGSFTVIGDMTSLMLWVREVITPSAFALGIILPAITTLCLFNLLLSTLIKGNVETNSTLNMFRGDNSTLSAWQTITMLVVGLVGLWSIPTFHSLTGFPPFIGALCVLALIWILESVFLYRINGNLLFVKRDHLKNTEFISTQIILYYLGITLGVAALKECGALDFVKNWLDNSFHNVYIYGIITGFASSVIDNVPFVMTGMNLFEIDPASADFTLNGNYWLLLSYCSAIGGSLLYVGTLAGHAIIDILNIRLSWYLRHIFWRMIISWIVGLLVFWLVNSYFSFS